MDVLALTTIGSHVRFGCDLSASNLGKFSRDVEGEGTELLHVDAFALAEVLVEVGDEGPPDDLHLRLGLQAGLAGVGPLCGGVMLSRVSAWVCKDAVT